MSSGNTVLTQSIIKPAMISNVRDIMPSHIGTFPNFSKHSLPFVRVSIRQIDREVEVPIQLFLMSMNTFLENMLLLAALKSFVFWPYSMQTYSSKTLKVVSVRCHLNLKLLNASRNFYFNFIVFQQVVVPFLKNVET